MAKKKGTKGNVVRIPRSKNQELAMLAQQGKLHPRDVVAFARDPGTKLHGSFEWDDTKAAAKYRLEQAREVIRGFVITIAGETGPVNVRALFSLPSDRADGGGYTKVQDVLNDQQMIDELVEDALKELARVKARYEAVRALSPIWAAVDGIAAARPRAKKAA